MLKSNIKIKINTRVFSFYEQLRLSIYTYPRTSFAFLQNISPLRNFCLKYSRSSNIIFPISSLKVKTIQYNEKIFLSYVRTKYWLKNDWSKHFISSAHSRFQNINFSSIWNYFIHHIRGKRVATLTRISNFVDEFTVIIDDRYLLFQNVIDLSLELTDLTTVNCETQYVLNLFIDDETMMKIQKKIICNHFYWLISIMFIAVPFLDYSFFIFWIHWEKNS